METALRYFETVGFRRDEIKVHVAASYREALVDFEIEKTNATMARLAEVKVRRDGRQIRRIIGEVGRVEVPASSIAV